MSTVKMKHLPRYPSAHCHFIYRDHHGFSLARKKYLNHQVALRIVTHHNLHLNAEATGHCWIFFHRGIQRLALSHAPRPFTGYATTIHPKGANWSTTLLGCPASFQFITVYYLNSSHENASQTKISTSRAHGPP